MKSSSVQKNPPWNEYEVFTKFNNKQGFSVLKQTKTTNLKIRSPKQNDPYSGLITDTGQLRPLLHKEQHALIQALETLGNTQMTLIHLFSLFTGARIQTVLTIKVRHVRLELPDNLTEIRFLAGPGTGVDTKNDKRLSIFIPRWLFEKLRIFSYSDNTKKRQQRAGDESEDQYLFFKQSRGSTLYIEIGSENI